ncbi:MAG TPA: tetratricopeptide repeat protein [Pseudonocardiaceae bacterium]|jgi:tetratricopeptide (TPR) repeat protein
MTLTNLGSVHQHLDRFDDALDCHLRALEIRREVADRYGEGVTLNNLGVLYGTLGRWPEAVECHRLAATAFGRAAAGKDADRAARHVAELSADHP